jgi:8-oxo-dGTP pyrophosphatase MutT (NUDIX family)
MGIRHVVAAVIEREGRLLVAQRPKGNRHAGKREFPGGKVEPGESRGDAIRRELAEELGVDVLDSDDAVFASEDTGSDFIIEFFPVTIQGVPRALEHRAVAWVLRQDLLSFDLVATDRRFAEWLPNLPAPV